MSARLIFLAALGLLGLAAFAPIQLTPLGDPPR